MKSNSDILSFGSGCHEIETTDNGAYGFQKSPPAPRSRPALFFWAALFVSLLPLQPAPCHALDLYGISIANNTLFTIDPNSGAATTIGSLGVSSMEGLAYDSADNKLFGISYDGNLYSINRSTGAASLVGATHVGIQFPGLEYDPNNGMLYLSSSPFYAAGQYTSSLYRVNPATGAASIIAGFTGNTVVDGLAFNPNKNVLYGVSSATYEIYTVNTATAQLTPIDGVGVPLIFTEAAYNASTDDLYWTDAERGALYARNMTSGVERLVGPTAYEVRGLAFAPAPAPEPSTVALAALGVAGLFFMRRIRHPLPRF